MDTLYKHSETTSYDVALGMTVRVTKADLDRMRSWLGAQRLASPHRDDQVVATFILHALQIGGDWDGGVTELGITSCRRTPPVYMVPLGLDTVARVIVFALLVSGGVYALVRIGHAIAQLT